jgi:hypothetical protein
MDGPVSGLLVSGLLVSGRAASGAPPGGLPLAQALPSTRHAKNHRVVTKAS